MKFVLAITQSRNQTPLEVLEEELAERLAAQITPVSEFLIGGDSTFPGEAHFMNVVEELMKHDPMFAVGFRSALTRSARSGYSAAEKALQEKKPKTRRSRRSVERR